MLLAPPRPYGINKARVLEDRIRLMFAVIRRLGPGKCIYCATECNYYDLMRQTPTHFTRLSMIVEPDNFIVILIVHYSDCTLIVTKCDSILTTDVVSMYMFLNVVVFAYHTANVWDIIASCIVCINQFEQLLSPIPTLPFSTRGVSFLLFVLRKILFLA